MSENIERIRYTISTPGWTEDLTADWQREITLAMDMMMRPLGERGEKPLSDDFLRGYVRGLRYAAQRPGILVDEADAATQRHEEEKQEAELPAAGSPYAATPEQAASS